MEFCPFVCFSIDLSLSFIFSAEFAVVLSSFYVHGGRYSYVSLSVCASSCTLVVAASLLPFDTICA